MNKILRATLLGLVAFVPLACDLPTIPSWDVRVQLPSSRDSLPLTQFLPANVSAYGADLSVANSTVAQEKSLASLCGICSPGTSPLPALEANDTLDAGLPGEIVSAALSGGSLVVRLTHDFPYDLLLSATGATGSVSVSLLDSANNVVKTASSAPGAHLTSAEPLQILLPLAGTVVKSPARVVVTLSSPGSGTPYAMTLSEKVRFEASLVNVRANSVSLSQGGRTFNGTTSIDMPIDSDLRQKLSDRTAVLDMKLAFTYPFAAPTDLILSLQAEGSSQELASTSVRLGAGTTNASLSLDHDAVLHLLAGEKLHVSYSGVLAAGPMQIRAGDAVRYSVSTQALLNINR